MKDLTARWLSDNYLLFIIPIPILQVPSATGSFVSRTMIAYIRTEAGNQPGQSVILSFAETVVESLRLETDEMSALREVILIRP